MRMTGRIFVGALMLAWAAVCGVAGGQSAPKMKSTEESDIARGKAIYTQRCEICHFSASKDKKIGPGLEGIMKQREFSNHKRTSEANLREIIESGGKDMPGFRGTLDAEQIRELIAYVKTL